MSGNLKQSDEMEGKGLFMSTLLFVISFNLLAGHTLGYMYYGGSYTGLVYGLGLTGMAWIGGALLAQYDLLDSSFWKGCYLLSGLFAVASMIYVYAGASSPVILSEDVSLSSFESTEGFITLYSLCIRNYLLWVSLFGGVLMLGSMCLMSEAECSGCNRGCGGYSSTMSSMNNDCCFTSSNTNDKKPNIADSKTKKSKR